MSRPRCRPQTQRPPRWALVDTCDGCGQVLAQAISCPGIDDDWPTAVRWGQEHWWHEAPDHFEPLPRCPSCWTTLDQHHHLGCIRTQCELCDDLPLYACPHGQEGEADP